MSEKCVAVVGTGYWGRNLVRNFYQLGVLKTICDESTETLAEMSSLYPEVAVCRDLAEILTDGGVRGVVIASPAALHYEMARRVLEAGKHCFVEKPLALTYEEGQRLVRLAAERQKTLFVGHILHYHPAVIRLKELVREGVIGRLQYIYSRRLSLGKIRREENILWSFAPHDISIILSLTGEEPSYVDAVGSNFLHARIADVTVTNLKFPSGIGAHIFVSWLNPFKEQKLVVVGTQGMIVFDDTEGVEKKLVHYPHTIQWHDGQPVPQKAEGLCIDITPIWKEPLRAECEAFIAAFQGGGAPLTTGEEGLRVLKVLEISQRSLEEKERRIPGLNGEVRGGRQADFFAHETAVIDPGCAIGAGTKIWHFSHVLSGTKIGENCNIGQNVVVGPDVTIGARCKIQNNVSVYKGVTLEDGVFCGPSMVFTNIYNPRAEIGKMDQVRPTLVKRGATLGANCTVVCGVTIGRYAFVGAGAVVTRDVPDHALVVGNPARQIGYVCECGEGLDDNLLCPSCGTRFRETPTGLEAVNRRSSLSPSARRKGKVILSDGLGR